MLYIHDTPGRLRLSLPTLKRNAEAIQAFADTLKPLTGIIEVCVNTLAGSVTVRYDARLVNADAILQALKSDGLLDPAPALRKNVVSSPGDRAISRAAQALGEAVFEKIMEKALEKAAVALVAAVI